MLPTNEIVARITGMSKRLLSDGNDNAPLTEADDGFDVGGMASPSPRDVVRASPKKAQRTAESKLVSRGDNAAYQYDKVADQMDSQDRKSPKHRMPPKEVDDDMYGADDQDSSAQNLASKKATSEAKKMKKFIQEHIGSMDTYRFYAGLPSLDEEVRVGHSGDVPTAGVNKQNKMKAGLPGLEGDSLQKIDPEQGPADEDEVGDAETVTLDQAIAMLKKEGVDTDALWDEFLENRGLSLELFNHLIDEAIESNDADEMDALLAVEGLFHAELPRLIPEGLADLFRKKQPKVDQGMAAVKKAGQVIRTHGAAAVRDANRRGMAVTSMKPASMKRVPTPKAHVSNELGMAKSIARKTGTDEAWEMECDHDHGSGGPRMPWTKKMESLAARYTLSENTAPKKTKKNSKSRK